MGYTVPRWLDDVLDFIGINFPNVDEDDYHEMADAMQEFADKFEGHGGDAHKAVTRILSSSEGWAVDAMEKHWSHVKAGHLGKLPQLARLFADACDVLADIIFGMKTKAAIELGAMAASVGISAGLTRYTYDHRGNRTSLTSPTGHTTRFDHDEVGRPTAVTEPLGKVIGTRRRDPLRVHPLRSAQSPYDPRRRAPRVRARHRAAP
ncbi:RHS repeat domain-containing protein, partial [Streptomyces sp. 1222.5]|uniref:RHS repeat domain-containing protein n=1 Tax=Streptomyces sp. 1222.5 TaxID=1881026 RepID=UPI003EBCF1EB